MAQDLNRTLFISDNLPVLRGIDSESIDLIATDPPFNKGVKAFEGITAAGENVSYSDVWTWSDVQVEWTNRILGDHPALYSVIQTANAAAGDSMGAFLCWLGVRVLEMHRILKPTGSMYLHCDPTASHYLKSLLDAVFGQPNFRNEIIWRRTSAHGSAKRWGPIHDTILFYTKTNRYTWNRIFQNYDSEYLDRFYRHSDSRGRHRLSDLTAPGIRKGASGEPWRGINPTDNGRHWGVPQEGTLHEDFSPPSNYAELSLQERLDVLDEAGFIHWPSRGTMPSYKRYLKESEGPPIQDMIWDIAPIGAQAAERTGYPTQKPLALYERIIRAASNVGDMVVDPFAGCATTCVAAERLGREWVGIDVNEPARDIIQERLQGEVSASMAWDSIVRTPTQPPERTDGGAAVAPELVVVSRKRNARRLPIREIRERLIISDGQRCQGCGWEPSYSDYLQVDHKKPRSLGGADDMDNLTLLCDPCNRFKSNKLTLTELRQARVDEGRVDADWWKEERWR